MAGEDEMNVKHMKVSGIRDALKERGLATDGLKSDLVNRLEGYLKEQQEFASMPSGGKRRKRRWGAASGAGDSTSAPTATTLSSSPSTPLSSTTTTSTKGGAGVVNETRRITAFPTTNRTTIIPIQLRFHGGCRSPTLDGAGCQIIIEKGRRYYPVEEAVGDCIEIRHYPERSGGGYHHTSNKMEYEGLLVGLQVVLQHVPSTNLRQKDRCFRKLRVEISVYIRQEI